MCSSRVSLLIPQHLPATNLADLAFEGALKGDKEDDDYRGAIKGDKEDDDFKVILEGDKEDDD